MSIAVNVTVVVPIGNSVLGAGDVCTTLATPLQSVASGNGKTILAPQSSTSTAKVSSGTQVIAGPSLSSAMIILAIAVEEAPHPSTTVQVTGIVAPQEFNIIVASKSFVMESSVTSEQLSIGNTSSNHVATINEISCPQPTIRSEGAVSVGTISSVTMKVAV